MARRTGSLILVLILAAAAGCSSGKASRSASPASTSLSAAAHHPAATTKPTTAANLRPGQLRVQLEQLFGQHALLAVRLMRSPLSKPDLRPAAQAALQANSDQLGQLITSAYGAASGDRFQQLWQHHLVDLANYADAVANKDTPRKNQARAALLAGANAYGAWMAEAAKGRITAAAATGDLRGHVTGLMGQIDAYADHEYGRAYTLEREAYEHGFATGTTMAKASLPAASAAALESSPEQLRSAFAMLLGEHMQLVVDAQRAAFGQAAEFKAAAVQVNTNTLTLSKAIGAIAGPGKAAEFQAAWADHVDGLIAYAAAVAGNDPAGKATAEQELDTFALRLARYFNQIINNRIRLGLLLGALTQHDRHLVAHVDAYAARDYNQAQQIEAATYQHMRAVADTLVGAIQRTLTPQLPAGGAKTGGGGTAHLHR
jgi:hypothetical protein